MTEKRYNGFSEENLRSIALKKVNFRMSVKIHLAVFLIGCTLLIAINEIFTPYLVWFIFPIFGWLIGFAVHLTSYLVYARGVYPIAKRAVIFHLVAFVFVMILLFVINLAVDITFLWVVIPAGFWSIGLAIHVAVYVIYHRGATEDQDGLKSRKERAVEKELEKIRKKNK